MCGRCNRQEPVHSLEKALISIHTIIIVMITQLIELPLSFWNSAPCIYACVLSIINCVSGHNFYVCVCFLYFHTKFCAHTSFSLPFSPFFSFSSHLQTNILPTLCTFCLFNCHRDTFFIMKIEPLPPKHAYFNYCTQGEKF